MEVTAIKESEELKRAREELFRELDKGIRDIEMGNLIPHDEAMKQIREELGLYNV